MISFVVHTQISHLHREVGWTDLDWPGKTVGQLWNRFIRRLSATENFIRNLIKLNLKMFIKQSRW